jgi:hypothetical protein
MNLTTYETLCGLRDRYLNFEVRYFAHFERTCSFRTVRNGLQDYTVVTLEPLETVCPISRSDYVAQPLLAAIDQEDA